MANEFLKGLADRAQIYGDFWLGAIGAGVRGAAVATRDPATSVARGPRGPATQGIAAGLHQALADATTLSRETEESLTRADARASAAVARTVTLALTALGGVEEHRKAEPSEGRHGAARRVADALAAAERAHLLGEDTCDSLARALAAIAVAVEDRRAGRTTEGVDRPYQALVRALAGVRESVANAVRDVHPPGGEPSPAAPSGVVPKGPTGDGDTADGEMAGGQ